MPKEKPPAYLWYPKDILTSKKVLRMTLEEECCFRRLLDYAWLDNGLDDDLYLLASYCRMTGNIERFRQIWEEKIKLCFDQSKRDKKWRNSRQEKERSKQRKYSLRQSKIAKSRHNKNLSGSHGNSHGNATAPERQCFSFAFSFSTPEEEVRYIFTHPLFQNLTEEKKASLLKKYLANPSWLAARLKRYAQDCEKKGVPPLKPQTVEAQLAVDFALSQSVVQRGPARDYSKDNADFKAVVERAERECAPPPEEWHLLREALRNGKGAAHNG